MWLRVLCLAALLTGCLTEAAGRVWYVNGHTAARRPDGRTWATAFVNPVDALAVAQPGDELWVAAGAYVPTGGTDRNATFQLREGVALYGGFAGHERTRDERDWGRHRTVLTGDIGTFEEPTDNVYHVVTGADEAILDGFHITGGRSGRPPGPGGPMGPGPEEDGPFGFPPDGPPPGGPRPGGPRPGGPGPFGEIGGRTRAADLPEATAAETRASAFGEPGGPGGGGGRPTHTTPDQVLRGPMAMAGAGMINYQASPTVRNCVFTGNQAFKGGAVYNMTSAGQPRPESPPARAPLFVNCDFVDNVALGRGGGVANDLGTHPTFVGCRFLGNRCEAKGGGMYNDFGCSPVVVNCLFAGNTAATAGAMGNDGASSPTISGCTFAGNHARYEGPSLYQGSGPPNKPRVSRSIVWGNTCDFGAAGIVDWHECLTTITDSLVEDGWPGAGNRSADPRFADPAAGDYTPAAAGPAAGLGYDPARVVDLADLPRPRAMERLPQQPAEPTPPAGDWRPATVVYVTPGEGDGGDGVSWARARHDLQQALAHAASVGAEVWLAGGTYTPRGDRQASFQLYRGVALYGGFAGHEQRREERDPARRQTILSGDIGRPGEVADNCYHVIVGAAGARLDGLTITGGQADGVGYDGFGGGLITYRRGAWASLNRGSAAGQTMTIVDCLFVANQAREGGAVFNFDRGEPVFERCVFRANRADHGGAVVDRIGVKATFTECRFEHNTARWRGGAYVADYGPRPTFTGCVFRGNETDGLGGAIYTVTRASQLDRVIVSLTDCRFEENRATHRGGAISNDDQSEVTATGCLFTGNRTGETAEALADTRDSRTTLTDCHLEGQTRFVEDPPAW